LEAKIPRLEKIGISATPVMPDRRFQDTAACNPAVKAAIDGIVDSGVIPDDTWDHLGFINFQACVLDRGNPALRVEVIPYITCTKCSNDLPETSDYFYSAPDKLNGLSSWCKECTKQNIRDAEIRRRAADPEGFATRKAIQARKTKLAKYGLTPEDYELLLEAQGGVCAICGTSDNRSGSVNLDVDHDHDTGAVRGLLCHHDNAALGMVGDDVGRLRAMIAYLESR